MMKNIYKKLVVITVVAGLFSAGIAVPMQTRAAANWPDWVNVAANMSDDPLNTFGWENMRNTFTDILKKKAMDIFRRKVMAEIGESGGLIGNYGKYIYASGDSAAAQFWNTFLARCTNIDTSISLAVKSSTIDSSREQYDWCPVKVSAGGVNLGNIDISAERGWEDFGKMVALNDPFWTYYKATDQVEEARQETETVYLLQALTGSGGISSINESGGGPYDETEPDFVGPPEPPAESENMDVSTYAVQFMEVLNAATQGTIQVQANYQGMLSAGISMALDYFIMETMGEDAFGSF